MDAARHEGPVLATAVVVGVSAGIAWMVGCFVLMVVCLDFDDPRPPPVDPDVLVRIGVYGAFAFGVGSGLLIVATARRRRGRSGARPPR